MFSFLDAHALGENTVLLDMFSRLERPTYVNKKKKQQRQVGRHLQEKKLRQWTTEQNNKISAQNWRSSFYFSLQNIMNHH